MAKANESALIDQLIWKIWGYVLDNRNSLDFASSERSSAAMQNDYFQWIDSEGVSNECGYGRNDVVLRGGQIVVDGVLIPQSKDYVDRDSWEEDNRDAMILAGGQLIERYSDFEVDGRAISNLEMLAISYWTRYSSDAAYMRWIDEFCNWLGVENEYGSSEAREARADTSAEGLQDDRSAQGQLA